MSAQVAHEASRAPATATTGTAAPRVIHQRPVTFIAAVKPRRLASLRRLLERIGDDPAGNPELPLGRLTTAHYARLVVLEPSRDLDGKAIAAQLVFMSDIDEPLAQHLDELVALAPGLDRVFGHCVGYPPAGKLSTATRLRWLERHLVPTQAFYTNTVGRTVSQIHHEAQLRDALQEFLDAGTWDGADPLAVRAAIQHHVARQPKLAWALTPADAPGLLDRARDVAAVALPVAGLLAAAPALVPLLGVYAVALRWQELHDHVEDERVTAEHDRCLAELEDRGPQNQFSAIGFVKPGLLRRATVEVALRGIDIAARHVFNRSDLAGVKTIHFAHWTKLDGGRRVIFTSNYDGTVKSYNDDFIDKLWWGLNLSFSNGVGWPRTAFLLWGGAQDEQPFKEYLRRHQIPTQVWYCAYPDLTAVNINNNAKIRAGLSGDMNSEEVERWLRLL